MFHFLGLLGSVGLCIPRLWCSTGDGSSILSKATFSFALIFDFGDWDLGRRNFFFFWGGVLERRC